MKINETNFGALVSYVTHIGNVMLDMVAVSQLRLMVEQCEIPVPTVDRSIVSEAVVNDLLSSMNQHGKKIEAIRAYRNLTNAGLKEAKDAVEKYWVDADPPVKG